ncbi:MAG: hypothetical protein EB015_13165 [Methylocystaceae bacterium]|nr:hypothetical protein [Methylocystaceae bacterium]
MRQELINVYKFEELSEKTQEKILNNWRQNSCEDYSDELSSIQAYCDFFNVKLINYEIGGYRPLYYKTNANNENFRGRKLKDFNPDYMPTGLYIDCDLWGSFYKHFEKTGDCKGAFDHGLWAGFKALETEIEERDSDEYIKNCIEINEYEFYDDGSMA